MKQAQTSSPTSKVRSNIILSIPIALDNMKSVMEDASGKTANDPQHYKAVCSSFLECLKQCINSDGDQFEHSK
jgi:hypothetical protein